MSGPKTNITKEHQEHFDAIRKAMNIALFSCFLNGEPTSAIVAVNHDEQSGEYTITPLFVAVTPGMVLTDHDGGQP